MFRPSYVAVVLAALAFLIPLAGSSPAAGQDHANVIKGLAFNPEEITIRAGDSVTWVNRDSDRHRVQGDGFESKELANGNTYTVEFPEPAHLRYHCSIHTYMEGRIVVLNPDGSVPPSTAGEPEAPPAPSTTTSSTRPPGPLDGVIER